VRTLRSLRRPLRWIGFLGLAFVVVLALLALAIAAAPFPALQVEGAQAARSVQGVFHVHAEKSHDGFGTLEEAAAEAKALGNRFLVLTEHNTLRPSAPRVVDGVLVIPGIEISSAHGHVIAVHPLEAPADHGRAVLASIREAGGVSVLAHPVNLRRPWTGPYPGTFDGFEALSLDSALRTSLAEEWGRIALAAVAIAGDDRKAGAILMGRPADALARYDEESAARRVSLLCGVDAHGRPPYRTSFAALALHVELDDAALRAWGGDPLKDAAAVVAAIREGATYCSVPAFGDASSFRFGAEDGAIFAEVQQPDSTLVIHRGGVEVARSRGPRIAIPRQPGIYRAEVLVDPGFPYGKDRLWITTSSLRIR